MFLTNHAIFMLFAPDLEADYPAKEQLVRPYFHDPKYTWPDETSVEFHLSHGATIDVLASQRLRRRAAGRAPGAGRSHARVAVAALPDEEVPFGMATRDWARQWPTEEAWVARKRG